MQIRIERPGTPLQQKNICRLDIHTNWIGNLFDVVATVRYNEGEQAAMAENYFFLGGKVRRIKIDGIWKRWPVHWTELIDFKQVVRTKCTDLCQWMIRMMEFSIC